MGLGNRRLGKKATVALAFFSCRPSKCLTIQARIEVV